MVLYCSAALGLLDPGATLRSAEVAPRVPAAASDPDADFAAGAVSVPVALVACWALHGAEVYTLLVAAYGPGAEAVGIFATGGFRTAHVVDGWLTLALRVAICPSHAREQGEKPTAKQS
jgi:hypothetical protein